MATTLVKLRKSAFISQSCRCFYCGVPMWENDPKSFAKHYQLTLVQARWYKCTAEHLVPRQDDGLDTPENIAAACLWCNSKRHRRKMVPEPNDYRCFVRRRLTKGRWHFKSPMLKFLKSEYFSNLQAV